MTFLTKDQILGADDITYAEVDVPEWGGMVRVKVMTGEERDAFEDKIVQRDDRGNRIGMDIKNFRAKLLARCVVDEHGKRVFNDQDVHALGLKSIAAMDRVAVKIQEINRLTDDDVQELTSHLEPGQSEDSTSD
jgi:hypothetical protein